MDDKKKARVRAAAPTRAGMIAKIHVAKKQLALTDDTYRAILERVAGQSSSAACSGAQLEAVLKEFARLGFAPKKRTGTTTVAKLRASGPAWVWKIYLIWSELCPLLDNAGEETLRAFTRRQTRGEKNPEGIADPRWLDAKEATKVIQGLEGWLAREKAKEAADV